MTSRPQDVPVLREAGFRSTGRYNINAAGPARPPDFEDYEQVMQTHREHWAKMAATGLPNLPVVTMGWDPTPWWRSGLWGKCATSVPRNPFLRRSCIR